MDLVIPADANLVQHLMRAKTNWNAPVPVDPCEETTFGETEDYMSNIIIELGLEDPVFGNSELIVVDKGSNMFDVSLNNPSITEDLVITVYNTLGQQLVNRKLENNNGSFNYSLNMSYVSTGIYLVRLGNNVSGKVKRIIVK